MKTFNREVTVQLGEYPDTISYTLKLQVAAYGNEDLELPSITKITAIYKSLSAALAKDLEFV